MYNYYGGSNPTSCATPSQGSGNNGNAMGYYYLDNTNTNISHWAADTYDSLNRLASHTVTPGQSGDPENYNQTFTYDRYGNADCSGSGYCAWPSYDAATNHVTGTGVTYDAAGNMTSDWAGLGNKTYQWDGEGRMTSVAVNGGSSETFTYNALGQRVERTATCWPWTTATCDEIYDAFGNLALIDRVSGGLVIYVPRVGGRPFAEYSNGYTWFSHSTALGSTGTVTDQAGNLLQGEIYYPWGQRWATSGSVWWDRFASMPKVRDVESGLDPTPNRMLTSQYGRWLSPDPLAGDITNPQSLNRYAYVLNNPTSLIDPLGLDECSNDAALLDAGGNVIGYNDSGCMSDEEFSAADAAGLIDPSQYSYIDTTQTDTVSADVSALGDIQTTWSDSSPTTITFESPYQFGETVQRLQTAVGLKPSDLDNNLTTMHLDDHPGNVFHLRDSDPNCSLHLVINVSPAVQVPTTGSGHLDTVNPTGGLPQMLAHGALDVAKLYPGSKACK